MARVLELVDLTGESPETVGDTAMLQDGGQVTYEGDGVRNIISTFLADHPANVVFDKMSDWSNGYVQLTERGA